MDEPIKEHPHERLTYKHSSFDASKIKSLITWSQQKYRSILSTDIHTKFANLTFSQYFYFAAFIAFLTNVGDLYIEEEKYVVVGVIAGIGLFRELWHLFMRVWDKMLGKGILLVLYAGTANFALAVSAQKINGIVGIEPSIFTFTLGFTTLIMLPFWLITSTVVFFTIAMLALNLWLLFAIIVRLIKIKIKVHWEDTSFVFLTMLLRLILVPSVILTLVYFNSPYVDQIGFFKQISTTSQSAELGTSQNASKSTDRNINTNVDNNGVIVSGIPTTDNEQSNKTAGSLDIMIANFIYWFETYPQSACIKEVQQRSLIIDDFSMLVAEEDDSGIGFSFSVKPCIPIYEQPLDMRKTLEPPSDVPSD